MQSPKPIILTHRLREGRVPKGEPIIMRWNGVDMPEVLRTTPPGSYLLLACDPPDESEAPTKEAA
jgi:hypothetical protein